MTCCVQLYQFCPHWWQDVLIAKTRFLVASRLYPCTAVCSGKMRRQFCPRRKICNQQRKCFTPNSWCKHVTPFDKCMSYTAVNSCEQNTSVPQFGWESLWGSSWSAPSHLFHAAGPMQILRQILTYLVCKMAVHFSLPLTHVGKASTEAVLFCACHSTVPDSLGRSFWGLLEYM